jgi:hypothetical protein
VTDVGRRADKAYAGSDVSRRNRHGVMGAVEGNQEQGDFGRNRQPRSLDF